jgi:Flp pilus assembly protein TadD
VAQASTPPDFGALQKAVETKMDAASFEALGEAYLSAQKPQMAQLVLQRALELEDGRAGAHSALGYARLLQGDAIQARGEYGKALDADPTFDKARVNLAALRCRFGDVQGAKRDLSVVRSPNSVVGADVDPAWRSCR